MKMRKLSVILMLLLSGTSVVSYAKKPDPALLYFQHANSGTLQKDKQAGCYQMRLTGINKDVIYLSNSPEQMTGKLSIPVFISSWNHDQQTQHSSKPNAILHANVVADNTQVSDAFFIKSIAYETNGLGKSMVYHICRFNDEAMFRVGKLQDINIFVDPFHRWPP